MKPPSDQRTLRTAGRDKALITCESRVLASAEPHERFKYDPGDNRWKHKRTQDRNNFRYFLMQDGKPVGQCHPVFRDDPSLAAKLLNNAVEWTNPRNHRPGPHALFAFHDGVVYKALATEPGRSFHGFPIKDADLSKRNIPPSVRAELLRRARLQGQNEKIERWLEQDP